MSPIGWLTSTVARAVGPYPLVILKVRPGARLGALLTWLIAPPVEPRPKMTADGPFSTSTDSRLKVSRVYMPKSRIPSTKMSLRAENPRRVRLSPWAPPPSPAAMLTPVTFRRASRRLKAACSRMTSSGTTVTDCGVS